MKDDEREIGWAPRKIRELQVQVAEIQDAIGIEVGDERLGVSVLGSLTKVEADVRHLSDIVRSGAATPSRRVDRLERRLTHGTGDMAEPLEVWTDRQLSKLAAGVTEASIAIDSVSEELAGTDKAVAALNERISQLENHLETIGYQSWKTMADKVETHTRLLEAYQERLDAMTPYTELEFRVSALEGHPRRSQVELDFSPPVGGRKYERDLDDELDGIPDVHGRMYQVEIDEIKRRAYRDGYAKGQVNMRLELADSTLRAAESRVRNFMRHAGIKSAVIRDVIAELWRDEVKSPTLTGMPAYDPTNRQG